MLPQILIVTPPMPLRQRVVAECIHTQPPLPLTERDASIYVVRATP
jgi:hypothetical protein